MTFRFDLEPPKGAKDDVDLRLWLTRLWTLLQGWFNKLYSFGTGLQLDSQDRVAVDTSVIAQVEQFSTTEHATGATRGGLAVYEKSFTVAVTLDTNGDALVETAHGISGLSLSTLITAELSTSIGATGYTLIGEGQIKILGGAAISIVIQATNFYIVADYWPVEQVGTSLTCYVRFTYARS